MGRALNCSVNDVLLSCVAVQLARTCHDLSDDDGAGNSRHDPCQFAALGSSLQTGQSALAAAGALGMDNPIERVYGVRRHGAAQSSTQPIMALACWRWPG